MKLNHKKLKKTVAIFLLITTWLFVGFPLFFPYFGISPVYADTETIRPTDAYIGDSWSSPSNGYDGNTSTVTSFTNVNKNPSISFGGNAMVESTNSWVSKNQSWSSAVLYLTFSKTAGSNDTVEVLITDQSGNLKHTIVSSTSSSVTKQEFSQALNTSDWGGAGYPNIANLRVRVNGSKNAGPDNATSNMYDIRIDGTYTPVAVSISLNTDGSVSFGGIATNSTQDTTASGINDVETVNVDSGPVDLDVRSGNFSDGGNNWTFSSGSGADQVHWEFSPDGSSWNTFLVADTLYSLSTNVSQGGTQNVYFRLTSPTSTTSYSQYSATVTIVASTP